MSHHDISHAGHGEADSDAAEDHIRNATAHRLGLLGYRLVQLADGTFIATSPNCCRLLGDLAGARRFALEMGGAEW